MDVYGKRRGASVPARPELLGDADTCRTHLENPLSAATEAMMSVYGDEDGATALGLLHDYQAPEDRRFDPRGAGLAEPSAVMSSNYGSLDILDRHVQVLRSVPVNLSLNNNTAAQHLGHASEAPGGVEEARNLVGKATDWVARAVVKAEGRTSCPGDSYVEEPKDSGFCRDNVREEEMDHRGSPAGAEGLHYGPPAYVGTRSDCFQYSLEASLSTGPRQGEGPMAYLNRGQFYAVTLSTRGFHVPFCPHRGKVPTRGPAAPRGPDGRETGAAGGSALQRDRVVQTVIMVVFSRDTCRDEQLKNWKYWHCHQHTAKQRVLDLADCRDSFSTVGDVEEVAYNAVSFTWDVTEEAKVLISVNCLSTDFSSQKGVKGTPLIIQIDTYAHNSCSSRPIHRAFVQIKVFCDKGAERKLRDEEKKQLRKRMKGKSGHSVASSPLKKGDSTLFTTLMDLESQPVLFIPGVHFGNLQRAGQVFGFNREGNRDGGVVVTKTPCSAEKHVCPSQPKKSKVAQERKVLLYVRKEGDEVFDALMLHSPTLKALMEAISEKYAVPVDKMAKVYQKSKKGVLVNMDDNIVQHYSYEDTFILAIESSAEALRVTLSEI